MNQLLANSQFEFLEALVLTDSQSKNQGGVRNIHYLLREYLAHLNFECETIPHPQSAPLLIGDLKTDGPCINLISHADTVLSPHHSPFRIHKDKIVGAGVADNKAGIVIALRAVEIYLSEVHHNILNLKFINSPTEEIGSPGFHQDFQRLGRESKYSFGFEPSLEDGGVIGSRNGNKWIEIKIKGKGFHSGRAHKGHINAAQDLCSLLNFLHFKMMKIPDVTFHIGQINGGHSFNTICEEISVKIDTRFSCLESVSKIRGLIERDLSQHFHACSKSGNRSDYELEIVDFCPPLSSSRAHPLIGSYLKGIENIEGQAPKVHHCGGSADINHFYHKDLIALDGCGAIGGNLHRKDEYIHADSLETRSQAFANLLLEINQRELYGVH